MEVNCPPMGWHGREAGSSPFGGVSLVYQSAAVGATEQLERAYAYCGYWTDNGVPQPGETITWYADGSAQLHRFAAPEIWEDRRKLLQFEVFRLDHRQSWSGCSTTPRVLPRSMTRHSAGFCGSARKATRIPWPPRIHATENRPEHRRRHRTPGAPAGGRVLLDQLLCRVGMVAARGIVPTACRGDRQIALSVYFQDLIPGPGQSWAGGPFVNYYRRNGIPSLPAKWRRPTKEAEPPLSTGPTMNTGMQLPGAGPRSMRSRPVRRIRHGGQDDAVPTVRDRIPALLAASRDSIPTGMPARVLGLATRSQVYDAR